MSVDFEKDLDFDLDAFNARVNKERKLRVRRCVWASLLHAVKNLPEVDYFVLRPGMGMSSLLAPTLDTKRWMNFQKNILLDPPLSKTEAKQWPRLLTYLGAFQKAMGNNDIRGDMAASVEEPESMLPGQWHIKLTPAQACALFSSLLKDDDLVLTGDVVQAIMLETDTPMSTPSRSSLRL